jgi:hypothetical protein
LSPRFFSESEGTAASTSNYERDTIKPTLGRLNDDIDCVTGTSGTTAAIDESEVYELMFDLNRGGFLFVGQGDEVNQSAERREILDLLAPCEPGESLTPKQISTELTV